MRNPSRRPEGTAFYLPGIRTLADYEWTPLSVLKQELETAKAKERERAAWLKKALARQARFEKELDAERRKRADQIAQEIAADRVKERQQEIADKQAAWLRQDAADSIRIAERLVTAVVEVQQRRWRAEADAKLKKLTKLMNRSIVRSERNTLLARGVVRGRKS